jgi:hypothetical protein
VGLLMAHRAGMRLWLRVTMRNHIAGVAMC